MPWVAEGYGLLRAHSKEWVGLLDQWPELRKMLESEVGAELEPNDQLAQRTYDLMQDILK